MKNDERKEGGACQIGKSIGVKLKERGCGRAREGELGSGFR